MSFRDCRSPIHRLQVIKNDHANSSSVRPQCLFVVIHLSFMYIFPSVMSSPYRYLSRTVGGAGLELQPGWSRSSSWRSYTWLLQQYLLLSYSYQWQDSMRKVISFTVWHCGTMYIKLVRCLQTAFTEDCANLTLLIFCWGCEFEYADEVKGQS